jgi:uncharacterized protein (TIGR03546 family)
LIRSVLKLVKTLNSDAHPAQISLAFCFAMIVGFTPFWSFHNLLILIIVLLFRIHVGSFILGVIIFSALAVVFDPLFHRFGLLLLTWPPAVGFWTLLYNIPVLKFDQINNTVVAGGWMSALILFVPLFFVLKKLINKYREQIQNFTKRFKLLQTIKASKIYRLYDSISSFGSDS